jgi:hypothetical protein
VGDETRRPAGPGWGGDGVAVADCVNANCGRLLGNRHGRQNVNANCGRLRGSRHGRQNVNVDGAETFCHVCHKFGAVAQVLFRATSEFMYKIFTILRRHCDLKDRSCISRDNAREISLWTETLIVWFTYQDWQIRDVNRI